MEVYVLCHNSFQDDGADIDDTVVFLVMCEKALLVCFVYVIKFSKSE